MDLVVDPMEAVMKSFVRELHRSNELEELNRVHSQQIEKLQMLRDLAKMSGAADEHSAEHLEDVQKVKNQLKKMSDVCDV